MARVGEEAGRLPEVMEFVAAHYRERNTLALHRITQAVEPLIIVGMGLLIGAMLISVYLPMFQMASLPGAQ